MIIWYIWFFSPRISFSSLSCNSADRVFPGSRSCSKGMISLIGKGAQEPRFTVLKDLSNMTTRLIISRLASSALSAYNEGIRRKQTKNVTYNAI